MPVWCVTPNAGHCTHCFFDAPQISPSGDIWLICEDMHTDVETYLGSTRGREHQLGANLNCDGSDQELFFNDVGMNGDTRRVFIADMASLLG